jgi:large subunit ribosomal protein L21
MKYAFILHGGKQYHVQEGKTILMDKIDGDKDSKILFSQVVLVRDEDEVKIGAPFVEGAHADATIVEQVKGDKIRVSKFKAKVRYRRTTGFRPRFTKVRIEKISFSGKTKKSEKEQK